MENVSTSEIVQKREFVRQLLDFEGKLDNN